MIGGEAEVSTEEAGRRRGVEGVAFRLPRLPRTDKVPRGFRDGRLVISTDLNDGFPRGFIRRWRTDRVATARSISRSGTMRDCRGADGQVRRIDRNRGTLIMP